MVHLEMQRIGIVRSPDIETINIDGISWYPVLPLPPSLLSNDINVTKPIMEEDFWVTDLFGMC